jgi:hypothetical protein
MPYQTSSRYPKALMGGEGEGEIQARIKQRNVVTLADWQLERDIICVCARTCMRVCMLWQCYQSKETLKTPPVFSCFSSPHLHTWYQNYIVTAEILNCVNTAAFVIHSKPVNNCPKFGRPYNSLGHSLTFCPVGFEDFNLVEVIQNSIQCGGLG